jgi:hypothetical protein
MVQIGVRPAPDAFLPLRERRVGENQPAVERKFERGVKRASLLLLLLGAIGAEFRHILW